MKTFVCLLALLLTRGLPCSERGFLGAVWRLTLDAQSKTAWFASIIDVTAAKGMLTFQYPAHSSTSLLSASTNPALYTLTGCPQFHIPIARATHRPRPVWRSAPQSFARSAA
jgi:hypothetical protein